MTNWVRLWEDMPTDPKWRVVAKRSGRPVSEVIAVFVFMMTAAGSSSKRGEIASWDSEAVAVALDMETEHVEGIHDAMQGRVLSGNSLLGWDKRQPKREDSSAGRVRELRERERSVKRAVTHSDAPEESRGEENREEEDNPSLRSGSSEPPEAGRSDPPAASKTRSKAEKVEADRVVDVFLDGYGQVAGSCGLTGFRAITDARRSKILARAKDLTGVFDFPTPEAGFTDLFNRVRGSPFLTGTNRQGWKADLDWLLLESNFLKVMEGKYAKTVQAAGGLFDAARR